MCEVDRNTIYGTTTRQNAQQLEANIKRDGSGAVLATVHKKDVIVQATTWKPVTGCDKDYVVSALRVTDITTDVKAQGTNPAAPDTQEIIDSIGWPDWSS